MPYPTRPHRLVRLRTHDTRGICGIIKLRELFSPPFDKGAVLNKPAPEKHKEAFMDKDNKEYRFIKTPDGIAETDFMVEDGIWVWLGERDKRRKTSRRTHKKYKFDECEEINGSEST